jgi:hypothetical protein
MLKLAAVIRSSLLEIFFMAEKTAILGWVAIGQGGHAIGVMAFTAEFLSFLFPCHLVEPIMNLVMGQTGGGLFRGVPEE